jgi:hypothetical protein
LSAVNLFHRKQPVNGQACRRADPPGIGQHWTDQV